MWSELLTLRTATNVIDTFGDVTQTYVDTVVFANRKSATRAEFYNAKVAGMKISEVFEVHTEDYNNQEDVIYGGVDYIVERIYRKGQGSVELICTVRGTK
jgi:SPP1 family predicted phage head-tail adaptor